MGCRGIIGKSDLVSFGLAATAAAMRAKSGRFTIHDRLNIARLGLVYSRSIPGAAEAVERFLSDVDHNTDDAADTLSAFARDLVPCTPVPEVKYAWQERADLQ